MELPILEEVSEEQMIDLLAEATAYQPIAMAINEF